MDFAPCPNCYDPGSGENRGSYMYDESHGKPCELCCEHSQGFWLLLEHYGEQNGRWCCRAGCGLTVSAEEHLLLLGSDPTAAPIRSRPSALAEDPSAGGRQGNLARAALRR